MFVMVCRFMSFSWSDHARIVLLADFSFRSWTCIIIVGGNLAGFVHFQILDFYSWCVWWGEHNKFVISLWCGLFSRVRYWLPVITIVGELYVAQVYKIVAKWFRRYGHGIVLINLLWTAMESFFLVMFVCIRFIVCCASRSVVLCIFRGTCNTLNVLCLLI